MKPLKILKTKCETCKYKNKNVAKVKDVEEATYVGTPSQPSVTHITDTSLYMTKGESGTLVDDWMNIVGI